jgi:ABC-type multidrug transport system ATPase subunit
MLVGPVNAFFMDNISNGLDSSTTFQIINSIRQSIHIFNKSALICLLQPPPETYELFDDIILLSEGQIVYEGPRECVLEFFEYMGFRCPETKGVAEYLQEVCFQIGPYSFHCDSFPRLKVVTWLTIFFVYIVGDIEEGSETVLGE